MKTVSRVLNKEPNVAVSTREKGLNVARELRYTPNLAARGLANSKSYLIAPYIIIQVRIILPIFKRVLRMPAVKQAITL